MIPGFVDPFSASRLRKESAGLQKLSSFNIVSERVQTGYPICDRIFYYAKDIVAA